MNSLGAKSRAGLMGAPQLNPKAKIIRPKSVTPMAIGTNPLGVFMFLLSVMAQMRRRKKETQMIWNVKFRGLDSLRFTRYKPDQPELLALKPSMGSFQRYRPSS